MIQTEVTRHFLPPQEANAKAFIKPVTDNTHHAVQKAWGPSQAWEASHLHNTSETQQLLLHYCRSLNRLGADLGARINFTPVSTALNKDCPMQAGYPLLSNGVQHGMVAQEPTMHSRYTWLRSHRLAAATQPYSTVQSQPPMPDTVHTWKFLFQG